MPPKPIDPHEDIRWGIVGAGTVAAAFAGDITTTAGNTVTAVAARDADRAAEFGRGFGARHSYGRYADLFADDAVDVVYIATTHPSHAELALAAIAAGKSVLVEKPVALNAAATREVFDAAQHADVFAMEAMWMRTNPLIRNAQHVVRDGGIGDVQSVRASLSAGHGFDPTHRLYDLTNGGGALLDLGIYPMTLAWLILGTPDSQQVIGSLADTGADATVELRWHYDDGRIAELSCSIPGQLDNGAVITGTDGSIELHPPFVRPRTLSIRTSAGATEQIDHTDGAGYGPEIAEVARCLHDGLVESPLVPQHDTLQIMMLLDTARAELGVRYPSE